MKYPKWNMGQTEALLNIIGGEQAAKDVLRGRKKVYREKEGYQPLFDLHGWRLPPPNMKEQHHGCPVPNVCLASPIDFADNPNLETRFVRTCKRFGVEPPFKPSDFRGRASEAKSRIARDEATGDVLRGPCLPIFLPPMEASSFYWEIVEKLSLFALVGQVFEEQFPGQRFHKMEGRGLQVREGSRHDKLVAAMNAGPVVALYFPMALQGYLPRAAVEQMESLPEYFLLSGAIDVMAAMIMYPDVLARDANVPDLECAGVGSYSTAYQFQRAEDCLYFSFSHYVVYGHASAGLTVIA
ncbi:hypothetical protein KKD80_00445 [Patescibacteria group bacterium]|nr:hypothetical protein [Patescibacteria group bacterium]